MLSKAAEHSRRWRAKHPEYQREWSAANSEKVQAYKRRYRINHPGADRRWREANREKQREYDRRYSQRHRHKKVDVNNRRRVRVRGNGPGEKIDRLAVFRRDKGRCHLCGRFVPKRRFTLDHLVPIALGGGHTYANVKVAHGLCNARKGARFVSV